MNIEKSNISIIKQGITVLTVIIGLALLAISGFSLISEPFARFSNILNLLLGAAFLVCAYYYFNSGSLKSVKYLSTIFAISLVILLNKFTPINEENKNLELAYSYITIIVALIGYILIFLVLKKLALSSQSD